MLDPRSSRPEPLIHANAHTHTQFCDGCSTAAQMAESAEALGFTALGFSGHSPLPCAQDWTMSQKGVSSYVQEVRHLAVQYQGRMTIYLGMEADACSLFPKDPLDLGDGSRLDYIIGSVHMLKANGTWYAYDESPQQFERIVREVYGGDWLALSETYFGQVTDMTSRLHPLILGHFDLITKFNDELHLIDEEDPSYRKMAAAALLEATSHGEITEINTGAMARGRRKVPYPAFFLLQVLERAGRPVMINSDAHFADKLSYGFDTAAELLREAGYKSVLELGKSQLLEEISLYK